MVKGRGVPATAVDQTASCGEQFGSCPAHAVVDGDGQGDQECPEALLADHLDALRIGAVYSTVTVWPISSVGDLNSLPCRDTVRSLSTRRRTAMRKWSRMFLQALRSAHMIQVALQGRLAGRGVGAAVIVALQPRLQYEVQLGQVHLISHEGQHLLAQGAKEALNLAAAPSGR